MSADQVPVPRGRKRKFACPECIKDDFTKPSALEKHLRDKHVPEAKQAAMQGFVCDLCPIAPGCTNFPRIPLDLYPAHHVEHLRSRGVRSDAQIAMYHPELSSADVDEGKHDVAPISVVSAADAHNRESEVDSAVLVPDAEAESKGTGAGSSSASLPGFELDMEDDGSRCVNVDAHEDNSSSTLFQRWHALLPNSRDCTDGRSMLAALRTLTTQQQHLYEFIGVDLLFGTTEEAYQRRRSTAFLNEHRDELPPTLKQARQHILAPMDQWFAVSTQ